MKSAVPNLVTILEPRQARIENLTANLRRELEKSGFVAAGASIDIAGEGEMLRAAEILALNGAVFMGDAAGWPPAAVLLDLKERGKFTLPFVEVVWRGPNQPVMIQR